jgi:hypothetical protein
MTNSSPAFSGAPLRWTEAARRPMTSLKFDGYGVIGRKDGERVCLWRPRPPTVRAPLTRIPEAVGTGVRG